MIEFVLVTFLAYNFPSYFDAEQETNAAIIIDQAITLKEDPYFMVSLAWVESRVKSGRISHTGDYGLFQINYNFWGKKWGYKNKQKFLVDMSNPRHSVVAAAVVLNEMRRYNSCRGLNLPACYNGGPNWQKSKNKENILEYAAKVHHMRRVFKNKFPGWVSDD
ncbi:MAG: transglycosylase SLT domain-containing protein [Candidatus Poseidoniales archaeon]|jgi:hypothetical protein